MNKIEIPRNYKVWYIAESRKQPQSEAFKEWKRRGQEICYEVAYTEGFEDAAEAAYRHLSPSPKPEMPWLKDLIEMAEDGDKLNRSNGVHQEFLQENRETLSAARAYLAAQKSPQPEPSVPLEKVINAQYTAPSEPARESGVSVAVEQLKDFWDKGYVRGCEEAEAKFYRRNLPLSAVNFNEYLQLKGIVPSSQPEPSEERKGVVLVNTDKGYVEASDSLKSSIEKIESALRGSSSSPSVKPEREELDSDWEAKEIRRRIDEQRAESSSNLEMEGNWISVKERPEEYRQVLLWFEGLKTIAIGYLINGSWADENKNLLWCEPDYWAAMPTPPSQLYPSPASPAVQQDDGEVSEEMAQWITQRAFTSFSHGQPFTQCVGALNDLYRKMQEEITDVSDCLGSEILGYKAVVKDQNKQLSALRQEKETADSYNASLIEQLKGQLRAAYRIIGNYTPIKPTNNE